MTPANISRRALHVHPVNVCRSKAGLAAQHAGSQEDDHRCIVMLARLNILR